MSALSSVFSARVRIIAQGTSRDYRPLRRRQCRLQCVMPFGLRPLLVRNDPTMEYFGHSRKAWRALEAWPRDPRPLAPGKRWLLLHRKITAVEVVGAFRSCRDGYFQLAAPNGLISALSTEVIQLVRVFVQLRSRNEDAEEAPSLAGSTNRRKMLLLMRTNEQKTRDPDRKNSRIDRRPDGHGLADRKEVDHYCPR
jgi:hypothetical protein